MFDDRPTIGRAGPCCLLGAFILMAACGYGARDIEASNLATIGGRPRAGHPAQMPTLLAICRVHGHGHSNVVDGTPAQSDDALDALRTLDGITGVREIDRIVTGDPERVLDAARAMGAGLTLFYTFSSRESADDLAPPLGFLTFGLFPTQTRTSDASCSAVLVDSETGEVYATASGAFEAVQLANGYTTDGAQRDALARSLRVSFTNMTSDLRTNWSSAHFALGKVTAAYQGVIQPGWAGRIHLAERRADGWWVRPATAHDPHAPGAPPPEGGRYRTR